MALPQDLQSNSKELTVEGRSLSTIRKSFGFAPYQVTEINRDWTKGKGLSISSGTTELSTSKAKQKYEFSVDEPGRASWKVQCDTGANWSQLETEGFFVGRFGIEDTPTKQLACTLIQEASAIPSKLVMGLSKSGNESTLQGVLINDATQIDISATHEFNSTPLQASTPTGYVFRIGGHPVGAVEVINNGTVWLGKSVTPEIRSSLAVTSAVLLLYQDVQEELEGK